MKLNVLAQTKKKLKEQALMNSALLKENKHVNMYERLEQEYFEAVHDELETLNVFKEAVKDFHYKDDNQDVLIVKMEIKGKSSAHRIVNWLYESSR